MNKHKGNNAKSPGSAPGRDAWDRGSKDGYEQGWDHGYHLGCCESVMRHSQDQPSAGALMAKREVKIVYVTAGIGDPYPALDRAIIAELREIVSELKVVNPAEDVAIMAMEMGADLVLVLNGVVLPPEEVVEIRNKGIKTAIWFTDDPYYTDWTETIGPRYDYVFTPELNCVPFYKELGCDQVYNLPLAVNFKQYQPKPIEDSYRTDICFIGTAYWNRVTLIDRMAIYLSRNKVVISGWWWDRLRNYKLLADKIHLGEWMTPEATSSYYNGAKIVINIHREADDTSINANSRNIPAQSLNPRTFEVSACGTLQFSDVRHDMINYYKPDEEIVTYASAEELTEKMEYYLHHEAERRRIALNGLRRTLRDHTYQQRLNQLLDIVFL